MSPDRRRGLRCALAASVTVASLAWNPGRGPDARDRRVPSACSLAGPEVEVKWKPASERSTAASAPPPLRFVADVALTGSPTRFDYQSLDAGRGRLYIAHMGAGQLIAFDVADSRVLAVLDGFPRATGVLAVPAERRVYVSAAGAHQLIALEDSTLKVVARVGEIAFPDGIAYVPETRQVFVSDEFGRRVVVIDATSDTVVARIDLGGEAGNTQYDATSHCVFSAVQTANAVAVIDPASLEVVRRIRLQGVEHPHGLLIDGPRQLAFVAGEENAVLGVLDLEKLRPVVALQVGADPDVLAFDPGLRRLYVASESGDVSVFAERAGSLVPLGDIRAPHAHSVAVDPGTHRVYLPLENIGNRPVLRMLKPEGNGS